MIVFAAEEYFSGHTTGTADNNGRFFGFGLNVADGLNVEIKRVDGNWSYTVDGLDWTPAQQPNGGNGSPNLNIVPDLTVGVYAITPLNANVKTWPLQSFTAEVLPTPQTIALDIVQTTGQMQMRNVTNCADYARPLSGH